MKMRMAMAIKKRGSVLLMACVLTLGVFIGAGIGAEPPEKYETYVNGRFGYLMDYPDIFDTRRDPDNGDGVELASKDGKYTLVMWGGYNIFGQDGDEPLEESKKRVARVGGKEHIVHEYVRANADISVGFRFSYPKDEEKRFEKIVVKMENSLKLFEVKFEKGEES